MKKILYSLLLAATMLCGGCEKNVIFEQNDNFSDVLLVTSLVKNVDNQPTLMEGVNQGTVVYFMDSSRGVVSREWSLVGDDGYFLDDTFIDGSEDYTPFYMAARSLSNKSVYVQQSTRGKVKLNYKASFLHPVTYEKYGVANVDESIHSVYNKATGLYDFEYSYEYFLYEDLDVAYIVYPTDAPTNVIYAYTHADEPGSDVVELTKGVNYTVEIKALYGEPTSWSFAKDPASLMPYTLSFDAAEAGALSMGNIILTRGDRDTVIEASANVPIVAFNVVE